MKANIEVELEPFSVPNFVRLKQKEGKTQDSSELACYSLSKFDADTLLSLCEDFKQEVFRKAGKTIPAAHSFG